VTRPNKNLFLAAALLVVLAACGPSNTGSAPDPGTSAAPPAPTVSEANAPTEVPADNPSSEPFQNYIGMIHPPLPEGLTERFGMLIQDVEDHSLTLVSDGASRMLWLNKLDHYDANGSAFWEVKDILDLSAVEAGLTLIPDGCFLNGALDSEIFVAGKDGTVRMAWRANTTLDQFEVIPTKGIECRSDKAMDLE
jgi:hypothetical protein